MIMIKYLIIPQYVLSYELYVCIFPIKKRQVYEIVK